MADRPWLDGADPELKIERALLRRLSGEQPPVGSVERGWAALAAELGALDVAASLGQAHTQTHTLAQQALTSSKWTTLAKLGAALGVAGGVAYTGGQMLDTTPAAPTPTVAPSPPPQSTPHVAPSQLLDEPSVDPMPSVERPAPRQPASSTLAEEGKLLAKARQLMQGGQVSQALTLLQSSAQRYPNSVLSQEREVLTIEALGASGALPAAKQRAKRFVQRYPASPYQNRLQRFVE
jgi:hypothetical protein